MKKIININFQGRVIPIEESAYDILQDYIVSLRGYFAYEESRDEIINDIESRIAELFSDRLKRTTTCITDDDVNTVIASIGRPADLEEAEGTQSSGTTATKAAPDDEHKAFQAEAGTESTTSRRLFRSENDKILGGVSAGLGHYFGIDPTIMRLLFVLFMFMGFGLLLYVVLWIVVPATQLNINVRKRLFRNPEVRMLGGIAGGISAYLNIDVLIPRLLFLAPFILGVLANIFRVGGINFDPVPNFFFKGFGGTFLIVYIILWIVLPEATTATEKLEMRGEKVDLESIKKTVKEEFETLKVRAEKFGGELKDRAETIGQDLKKGRQHLASETAPVVRRTRSGLGHAIGLLFKAFFLFIAGVIIFTLVTALVALLFSGVGAFPFKDFLLNGFWQNFLAWTTLILFLGIPIIALLTWLIRRVMGVRSTNHYLGYSFGSLWIIGLVCALLLTGSIARNFRSKTSVKENVLINQPSNGKLAIKVTEGNVKYYGSDWFGFSGDLPFFSKNEDSIMMNTVRVKLIKSADSQYHVYAVKFSNGNTPAVAEDLANKIVFPVNQSDSVLYLPKGFTITQRDKFRNQQVMVIVETPLGKIIEVDRNVDSYNWFNINVNRRNGWNSGWDERWDNSYYWNSNREYLMTSDGLKDMKNEMDNERKKYERSRKQRNREFEDDTRSNGNQDENDNSEGGYRYKDSNRKRDTVIIIQKDTSKPVENTKSVRQEIKKVTDKHGSSSDAPKALYTLLTVF